LEHGLWHRSEHRMSSCSNHAERFHGIVNEHLKRRSTLVVRLKKSRSRLSTDWSDSGKDAMRRYAPSLDS
jgi:hypothetical protein